MDMTILNDVYSEKILVILKETDIITVSIRDKFGIIINSIIILKNEWKKIK